jgi:hypothetical protein
MSIVPMSIVPNRRPQLEPPKPVDTRLRRESPFRPAPAASPQEAAAIVAALERFMRDTAPPPAPEAPPLDPWRRIALLEAVGHEPDELMAWPENT